ncbi:diguanylate cyclase [Lysobacter korlensis]|uniref:diguanylate cyclase n=1 Tax=Lysobacter korlensis TaxID=553636 RepID=A0ABV6RPR8_9GAMM
MTLTERLVKFRTSAFLLAVVLLAGVGFSAIWGIVEFSKAAKWIEHSYEVLAKNEEVKASLRATESAARAYRLTAAQPQYAEYLRTVPLVTINTGELVRMVADSPERTALAVELRRVALERLDELQYLVVIQNTEGAERARALTASSNGLRLMDSFLDAHNAFESAERAVLAEREAGTRRTVPMLIGFVASGTLLAVALLGLMLAGLARENRRVRELERQAREAMRQLEVAAVHRDRLSEQRRALGAYAGLLQSCQNLDEVMTLTASATAELLPAAGGRCYMVHPSQNLLESASSFGTPSSASEELMQPDQCWALRRGQVHRTEPGNTGMRCGHLGPATHADEWTVCVPMTAHGVTLGLLHASGRADSIDPHAVREALEPIAEQLSQTIANLQLRESLRVQSLRDPLTGLYNRRYLEENLYRELQRCERRELPVAVMMLDVDHFKRFNDENGHAAGDAFLARVGEVLLDLTRGEDIACRYGGEEFTLVLPEATHEVALRRGEQIREAIAGISVVHLRRVLGPVTVSIGVACFPQHGGSPERLLAAADSALYRAKAEGRDRVVLTV